MIIVETLLVCLSAMLLGAALILFVQITASLSKQTTAEKADCSERPAVVLIVPAHNEEAVIGETLQSITRQLTDRDVLIVVADNCTDATASLAARAGADVVERLDMTRIGKAYALEAGVQQAVGRGCAGIAVFVDADCVLDEEAVDRLALAAHKRRGPVQGSYLMVAPAGSSAGTRIAAFSVLVRNHVRSLGARRLKIPVLITGSGWAAPMELVRSFITGGNSIVEDFELGLQFALAGHEPSFAPDARVSSPLPSAPTARGSQQQRWEQGVIGTTAKWLPVLVASAFKKKRPSLLGLAAQISVPPILMLGFLLAISALMGLLIMVVGGTPLALLLSLLGAAAYSAAIVIAWLAFGRTTLAHADLLHLPRLLVAKLRLYGRLLGNRQGSWIRTARDPKRDDG